MRVTLEKEYKSRYTLTDIEAAKAVIKYEKEEDEETAKGWTEYAVREALRGGDDYLEYVIEASAETARNCRAWNAYGEGTQDMDVWIRGTARTRKGFVEVGAYLTDIWTTGAEIYKHHMYIEKFERVTK